MAARLERAGVDRARARLTLSALGEVSPKVYETFVSFLSASENARAPHRQALVIQGERASDYAVALLRNALEIFRSASYCSVHVPTLTRDARRAMTKKEPSPFDGLLSPDVLVLDGFDAESMRENFFKKELLWVFGRRLDLGLATIVAPARLVGS